MNARIHLGLDRGLIKRHFRQCGSHDVQRLPADVDAAEQRRLDQLQVAVVAGRQARVDAQHLDEAGILSIDGVDIQLFANIELPGDVPGALAAVAREVGKVFVGPAETIELLMVAMLLFVNLVMGIAARVAQQLNLFAIGFPITLSVGLVGMGAMLVLAAE